MVGAFILSKKEKKTELKKMVFYSRLLGLEDLEMKWIVEFTRKTLVCADYISFCCPVVLFVYIYTYIYILHYIDDNILRTNIDT